ncbi:PilZ domain-containing protein [Sphingomonas sp. AP4-R1]|uniref:PilZ domain-containing protein n=1 Tax=Sphingomonas sp. AP4-R1 TaxID=2735134 RepID=UPI001493D0EC|nr:PilZ domain-containing protein [Sphingomonas sp. AP4-R1]QJU57820.1 PilZ domain-containing protein [Sphingomonas sp. AP4-R1]
MANSLVDVVRAGFRPREPRIRVHVPARMCAGETWHDITILNISSRGLMARTKVVPPSRSYVEIRRGAKVTIVGKVVWHDDRHFGIRTQDRIGISMMSDDGSVAAPSHDPVTERRARPRAEANDPAEAFERNRQKAAMFQFAALSGGGVAGAIVIANVVMDVLAHPLAVVASKLG